MLHAEPGRDQIAEDAHPERLGRIVTGGDEVMPASRAAAIAASGR